MSIRSALVIVLVASAAACGGSSEPTTSEPVVTSEGAELSIDSMTEGRVAGRLALTGDQISFESVQSEPGVYELTVKVHGVTLDSTIAFDDHTSSFDGFTAAGDDTALRDADRVAVATLYRAFNDKLPKALPQAGVVLRRALGIWGENPESVRLDRTIFGDEGRGYTMLCSYAKCDGYYTGGCSAWNWYSYAKHDCQHGDTADTNNQQIAQLGDHYSASGYDERYYNGSSWVWGEPDHWSRPKVTGNCFGRSGGGCGGDTQYTVDATNHDGCVRNGHALASAYCDDEFSSASDDELYAPDCY
jgi:hypothetical protein